MSNGWLKNSSATFLWPEESFCDNLLTMMSMAAWKWIKIKMGGGGVWGVNCSHS